MGCMHLLGRFRFRSGEEVGRAKRVGVRRASKLSYSIPMEEASPASHRAMKKATGKAVWNL